MNQLKQLININENPFILFDKWFAEAKQKEINDPNAMNLATTGINLCPSSRIVLLKSYNVSGFVFYTNLNSRKGNIINENANVVLNFHWKSLLKQVRIEGVAKLVSDKEADEYYDTRPINSRIGSWASNQSSELKSREELESKVNEYKKKFEGKKIPRPNYWSGYKVKPNLIEFWQEMPFRLHDRVEFIITKKGWIGRRLYP
jgi:pyridoxamine 5'-phosphate oxidase